MSANILDAITAATVDTVPTFTVSAGSNRIAFVLAVHTHGSNAAPVTSLTLGGQSCEVVATIDDDGTAFDVCATLFALKETGIAAMSGSTITPTGGTYNNRQYFTWSLQDADQGTLTAVTAATSGTSGSVSATRVADSYTVAFTVQDYGSAAFTGLANPSEAAEVTLTNGDIAYGYGTDTARTASFTWTHSTARNNVSFVLNVGPASTGPAIVSTSDDTPANGSTLTLTVQNAGASQGAGGITADGSGWTETSWSNTSIAVTVALGNNRYNVDVPLVLTTNDAQESDPYNVQIQPASGYAYFNLSGTPAASGLLEAIPELTGTEQIEVSGVVGGTVSGITINADGTLVVDGDITLWYARAHNGTEWGRLAAIDMTPDTTAPTLTSATIGTNGTSLTLVFSESVNIGSGGSGGVSINAAGGSATATYASGDGTNTLVYTLSRTLSDTETWADVDYVQPGDGIEDDVGNDLVSFFDVPVTNNSTQNAAPTDISLSISSIAEDAGTNTVVGQLSATDADWGDTHTFTLVSGTGSTNNASFTISGTSLICPDPATLGDGTYSIRVRATDSAANTFDKVFSIIVTAAAVVLERINHIETVPGTDGTADLLCEPGDLLVAWVSRDGSVTTPTMPSGWTSVVAGGASSLGYRLAWKLATQEVESSGTWTNATSIAISQYRPGAGYTLSVGAYSSGVNSSGTNALYPALTLQDQSGQSWVQCNYAHRSADISASDATASGLTVRAFVQDATDTLAVHTAAKVATFPATTVTYTGTSGSRRYISVEIKATQTASSGRRGYSRHVSRPVTRSVSYDTSN
jgi:hypothetical protein